jgi:hypothetical protein
MVAPWRERSIWWPWGGQQWPLWHQAGRTAGPEIAPLEGWGPPISSFAYEIVQLSTAAQLVFEGPKQ